MRKLTVWRRVGLWAAALPLAMGFLASGALLHAATPGTVAPVVPGHDRLVDAKADAATRGQLLLGELNCISCHKPEANARVQVRQAPDLTHAGARITPQYLQAYLTNPQALKPGTSMPNIFHASAPAAKEGAVEALTHYLVSLGGPIKPASVEGNRPMVAAGDRLFHSIGCVACHAPRKNGKPVDTKSPAVPLGDLAS